MSKQIYKKKEKELQRPQLKKSMREESEKMIRQGFKHS